MSRLALATVFLVLVTRSLQAGDSPAASAAVLHYRVAFADTTNSGTAAVVAHVLSICGCEAVPYAEQGFRGMMIAATAEEAERLMRDPNITSVRVSDAPIAVTAARPVAEARFAPNLSQLPANVAPDAVATPWDTGIYEYDAMGNIKSIDNDTYVYDAFGRLASATFESGNTQSYTYDQFGNRLTETTNGSVSSFTVDANTNRLAAGGTTGASYDAAGRLVASSVAGLAFTYDALDSVSRSTIDGSKRVHLYSATDERIVSIGVTVASGQEVLAGSDWTIRDLSGKVLRRFSKSPSGSWAWVEDYIYRDGQLLAAEVAAPERTLHFYPDHLGTPRLTTNHNGAKVSFRTYYPFGQEVAPTATDAPAGSYDDRIKFTGHERDSPSVDYMHARYYQNAWGRFLSVDPGRDWDRKQPQSWNLYSYVRNNPVNATDPDGRQAVIEFVAPYAPQVIASFATVYFLSRYSLHARANMRSRPGPVLVPPAVLSQRLHIVTPSGTILPGGTDVNLIPTATGTGWLQIHDAHPHDGAQPHTHRPETHVGPNGEIDVKRTDKPTTAEDIDEADRRVKDGELRPRTDRKDKGDRRPKPEPKKDEEPKEQQ